MSFAKKIPLAASLFTALFCALPAFADTVFNLRDPAIENIDEVSSFTLSQNGINATLTALLNGTPGAGTVLNQTSESFGVNAAGSGDATSLIDGVNGIESISIVFNKDVFLKQIVLSLYSTPTQSPPGDVASLVPLPGGSTFPLPMTSAVDTYNFTSNNRITAGQPITLGYVSGNGFSFDSFTVTDATPLPPIAATGALLLTTVAATHLLLRKAATS